MNLAGGGGQDLVGRIRLNVNAFRQDAQSISTAARVNARKYAEAYSSAADEVSKAAGAASTRIHQLATMAAKAAVDAANKIELSANRAQKALLKAAINDRNKVEQSANQQQISLLKSAVAQRVGIEAAADKEQKNLLRTAINDRRKAAQEKARIEQQAAQHQAVMARRAADASIREAKRAAAEEIREAKRKAKELAAAAANTPYRQFSKAVGEARVQLLAMSAASAAFSIVGLKAADDIQLLTIRYRELAGSEFEAARLMTQVADAARRMNVPVRSLQKEMLGLIPAVRQVNGNLDKYMNVALRLATLNTDSRGGIGGAIYAIREALSSGGTDLVSLSERFNIPRMALRGLIKETGSLEEALDIILDRYGATTAAAQAQAKTLDNLVAVIRDTVVQMFERTFANALNTAKNILEAINNILKNTPQQVLDLAAAGMILVGAFAAMALISDTLGNSFTRVLAVATTMKAFFISQFIPAVKAATTSMLTAIATNAKMSTLSLGARAGVTGAALAAGTGIGLGLVRGVGRATGDERLANYSLNDAFTTLKQLLFLAVHGILQVLKTLAKGISGVVGFFRSLGQHLQLFGVKLQIVINEIGIAVNDLIGNVEESNRLRERRGGAALVDVKDENGQQTFDDFGNPVKGLVWTGLIGQLVDLESGLLEAQVESLGEVDTFFDEVSRGFRDLLFPVEESLEAVAVNIGDLLGELITNTAASIFEKQGNRLAQAFDGTVAFMTEMADLIETGDTQMVEDRIKALERERDAITQLLPDLERYADSSLEAAEKFDAAQARLREIGNAIPQYINALTAATQRALADAQETYQEAIAEAQEKRDAALLKIAEETAEAMKNLRDEVVEKRAELADRAIAVQDEYNKAALKAEEDYRRKLAEIQRNFARAALLAASQLDAAGVAAAINAKKEQLLQAKETRDDALSNASERQKEQADALQKELDDLVAYYAKRRGEIFAQNVQETAEAQAKYAEEYNLATTARDNERNALMLYYDQRYADLQAALEAEQNIRRTAMAGMMADMMQNFLNLANVGKSIFAASGLSSGLGNFLGSVASQGIGAALSTGGGALSGLGQLIFQISGVTDPQAIAQLINQKLIDLAKGA